MGESARDLPKQNMFPLLPAGAMGSRAYGIPGLGLDGLGALFVFFFGGGYGMGRTDDFWGGAFDHDEALQFRAEYRKDQDMLITTTSEYVCQVIGKVKRRNMKKHVQAMLQGGPKCQL